MDTNYSDIVYIEIRCLSPKQFFIFGNTSSFCGTTETFDNIWGIACICHCLRTIDSSDSPDLLMASIAVLKE